MLLTLTAKTAHFYVRRHHKKGVAKSCHKKKESCEFTVMVQSRLN